MEQSQLKRNTTKVVDGIFWLKKIIKKYILKNIVTKYTAVHL